MATEFLNNPVMIQNLSFYCRAIAEKAGVPREDAQILVEALIEADLRGVHTHGVARLGMYLERVKRGVLNPAAKVKVVTEAGAVAVVDGDNGLGPVVGRRALELALIKAREYGVGVVGVRHSNHLGALGVIAAYATYHHMMGIIFTNTSPIMAPWGGYKPILGNNPFAIAVPRKGEDPLVLDISLSKTARGNIILAAREGNPIPRDWAINERGEPTTDPQEALRGAVLPMAEHKGYGLAVMVDILAGVLTGAAFASEVGSLIPPDFSKPLNMGHLIIALDISRFLPLEEFYRRLEEFIGVIKSSPLAVGFKEILLPGERGAREKKKCLKEGLYLESTTLDELRRLGEEYNVRGG
ncbi:Malate/lactate/ureidoglycolate dehydrogenase, LDH2 family [Thermanaeromonas toyohensis ToBE]|uniref:Malate/lactate/ureidoglycolate dehydrogenase, LDH2 family n=1 Tax=Thermanaeromonas toyohensis ToBE TaxID=698762 RepID=A0A1W1VPB9_9FIRM|nr:Malate/lactate/ureidoglycolate dehydrogenase, LDH2 family [Thermanaeromonas toyohensis ToBE]